MAVHQSVVDRFEAKYIPEPNSGCYLWFASTTKYGYGQISVDGIPRHAHRLSYEIHKGPIPEGLCIDHLCRVRSCVNPDHLEAVTNKENIMRGVGIKKLIAYAKSRPKEDIDMSGLALGGKASGEKQKAKTHCPKGHRYSEANTYITPRDGWRRCRRCRADGMQSINLRNRKGG